MRSEWSEIAFEDLEGIRDYIAKDAPFYADQFMDKLMSATDKLKDFPEIGRRVPEAENNAMHQLDTCQLRRGNDHRRY